MESESRLSGLLERLRSESRRSRRISWYAWGFLFAAIAGVTASEIVEVAALARCFCGSSTSFPEWLAVPIGLIPAAGLLAFTVREIWLGRREARGTPASTRTTPGEPPGPTPHWAEAVRESQEIMTRLQSETEFSFVPLILGGLGLSATLVGVLVQLSGWDTRYPVYFVELLALPGMLLLVPLYLGARTWWRTLQTQLSRQVSELGRLEGEFFARFAGIDAPA